MKSSLLLGKKKANVPAHSRNRKPARNPHRQGCLDNRLNCEQQPEGVPSAHARSRPSEDLWVAPRTSLTREADNAEWSVHAVSSSDARLLELADIALGLRKPQPFRKRRSLFLGFHQER